ncbi:hypothetical protein [Halococcus thailandensis]|uniref:hypothetical protein n=1 Tax=Halococcus thailandensis TaxID=335952 RepID=UPI000A670F0A|nr:hypothetical protein [Halococcus thailandensis]
MRRARKLGTVVLAVAVVLAAVYATGAFTSTSAERSADVAVAGDASAFLALGTSGGPNGQFASYGTDGALQVRMGEGTKGVNPGSRTSFQNVFTISNKGAQPVSVWFAGGSKAVTFVGPDGNPIESEGQAVTLRPGGQSLHVGLVIDSRGVQPGKNLLQSVEVHTATGEKSQANSIENVNSDNGTGGVRSDNDSNDRIENAGSGWSGDEETVTSNNDRSDTSENGNSGDARTDSNNDGSSGEQPHTVEIAGHTLEIPEFLADLSLEDAKTAIKGAFFGQTGMRDGMHPVESANSVFYILGQIAGSFVPTLGSVADARDAVQDAANGKLGTAALSAAGAIPGLAKLTEGQLAIRHLKDWKKSFGGEMAGDLKTLGQLIVNHVGPYMPNSIVKKALDVTTDGAVSTLKKDGFTVEQITEFSKDGNLEMMAEASESGLKLSPENTNFKRVSRLRNMDVPAEDVVWYVENGHSLKRVEQLVNAGFSPEAINDVYKQGSRGMEGVDWYSKANDYCSVQASLEPANRNHTSMCDLLPTQ